MSIRIIIEGPQSSGKSALAEEIAAVLWPYGTPTVDGEPFWGGPFTGGGVAFVRAAKDGAYSSVTIVTRQEEL